MVSMVMHTNCTCCFSSDFGVFLPTAALLDSRGSLSDAGVSSTTRTGALCSDGDAEEVLSAGVWAVKLNGQKSDGGGSPVKFTICWQLERWTPETWSTPLIFIYFLSL